MLGDTIYSAFVQQPTMVEHIELHVPLNVHTTNKKLDKLQKHYVGDQNLFPK